MNNTSDGIGIDVRVHLASDSDLDLLATFLVFAPDISVQGGGDQGHVALRATGPQIRSLATNPAVRRIDFDVEATHERPEDLPPGGGSGERYREFIAGRYPDEPSSQLDSTPDIEPDPDPE